MTCESHKWLPRPTVYFISGELSVFLECGKCGLVIFIGHHISNQEITDAIKDAA